MVSSPSPRFLPIGHDDWSRRGQGRDNEPQGGNGAQKNVAPFPSPDRPPWLHRRAAMAIQRHPSSSHPQVLVESAQSTGCCDRSAQASVGRPSPWWQGDPLCNLAVPSTERGLRHVIIDKSRLVAASGTLAE